MTMSMIEKSGVTAGRNDSRTTPVAAPACPHASARMVAPAARAANLVAAQTGKVTSSHPSSSRTALAGYGEVSSLA